MWFSQKEIRAKEESARGITANVERREKTNKAGGKLYFFIKYITFIRIHMVVSIHNILFISSLRSRNC